MKTIILILFITVLPGLLFAQIAQVASSVSYKPVDSRTYEETIVVNHNIQDLLDERTQYDKDYLIYQDLANQKQTQRDNLDVQIQNLKANGVGS